jgi:hypothetical protein
MKFLAAIIMFGLGLGCWASNRTEEISRGMNLTELEGFHYDASEPPYTEQNKTESQKRVDQLYALGFRTVILTPRAEMFDPRGSELKPMVKDWEDERQRYRRLIQYIHSKKMKVGLRPIFFVVDENGNFYRETLPDGTIKAWWHGNIQPANPDKWFLSFRAYLDPYLTMAKKWNVEEFTIGAELCSMTVGIDEWQAQPYGFPGQWLQLLKYAKRKLGLVDGQGRKMHEGEPPIKIMYDINFTDAKEGSGSSEASGGELIRWHYRLAELAHPQDDVGKETWRTLKEFWNGLDVVGIDIYRSLAEESEKPSLPQDYESLVKQLQLTASRYVSQMDLALYEISEEVGTRKPVFLKEIGFRSIEFGFINPFLFSGDDFQRPVSIKHQAAAYDAMFRAFLMNRPQWMRGMQLWDASIDPSKHGPKDPGFSVIGKPETEAVIQKYFKD